MFSRTGAVVAAASDYDASQVDNDSGVTGATVAAALDQLDTDKVEAGDDADTLGSGAAADGEVLTSDGAGGAAWEVAAASAGVSIGTLLAVSGATVALVYRSANTRWELPDGTVPTLTGRAASITWEGTSAQIPAQGTGDAQFQVGDTAFVRATSL